MVIYVDILVFTNIIIDYLLLGAAVLILKKNYSVIRLLLAAVLGGFSSLYIFVENNFLLLDLVFKTLIAIIMVLILNGFKKGWLLNLVLFLGLSFALNGMVVFLHSFTSSTVFYADNLVNYLNLSPITLVLTTAGIYLAVKIISRIFIKKRAINTAELTLKIGSETLKYKAMVDSGHTLTDPFSNSNVFILNKCELTKLSVLFSKEQIAKRKRVIPIKTVSSSIVLDALRFDSATIKAENEKFNFNNPIVAFSNEKIENDFTAIVPSYSLNRLPD